MNRLKGSKINNLLKKWPKNSVCAYTRLKEQGISRQLAHTYIKSGWLERIGRGAFKRAGDNVGWSGGLYALQAQLNMSVHAAGKTALQLQGNAHYIPANLKQSKIVLFGSAGQKLPAWFSKHNWGAEIRYVTTGLFGKDASPELIAYTAGNYDINISSPERAVLEFCYDVPGLESFDELGHIMSGLATLRPSAVQKLMDRCASFKVKRLFLYLAEKHNHAWFKKLKLDKISLGAGKRVIYKNGRYDSKYKIVIPA